VVEKVQADPQSARGRHGELMREIAKERLRLQVQDFVDWLKAQGAL
jgi:hypothetical protein